MKLGLAIFATVGALIGFLWLTGANQDISASPQTNQGALSAEPLTANVSPEKRPAIKYAPNFSLKNLDGQNVTLAQYRGQKPVILDFWASWCPNCQRDMPKINRWYQKYQDQVEIIGVNLQESELAVRDFVASRGIDFPIVLDPAGHASRSYGVRYTNYHVLIDKTGQLVKTVPGDLAENDITTLIES